MRWYISSFEADLPFLAIIIPHILQKSTPPNTKKEKRKMFKVTIIDLDDDSVVLRIYNLLACPPPIAPCTYIRARTFQSPSLLQFQVIA